MTASPHRLLIVDDEEPILRLLMDYLEDYGGFLVRAAESSEKGLEVLAREPADACIVDMRLPGMDGENFIIAAWERGLCRHFILHTGSVDMVLSDTLRRAGLTNADLFLKPTDMDLLIQRLRAVLQTEGE